MRGLEGCVDQPHHSVALQGEEVIVDRRLREVKSQRAAAVRIALGRDADARCEPSGRKPETCDADSREEVDVHLRNPRVDEVLRSEWVLEWLGLVREQVCERAAFAALDGRSCGLRSEKN